MTSDARIPVVGAMIVDPAGDALVKSYCASACDGRWGEAIFAALAEVTTSMGVYRKNKDLSLERARAMFADASLVQDMYDHVHLYSLPETLERLQFLLQGEVRTLAQCQARTPDTMHIDVRHELEADCAKVLAVARDVIVVDQTFPELRELGLAAAKVIAPGLLPVTFGHQYQRVDLARLDRFAGFHGAAGPRFTMAAINPHPHNFP
jgi:ribosomal protein S12 methylthiotransferase accessory factor